MAILENNFISAKFISIKKLFYAAKHKKKKNIQETLYGLKFYSPYFL